MKSAAEKVPFTKITGPKLIFQIDKKLYQNINKFGCRFMSMIAIPQIVTGKRLTADGIKYIYDQAVAGNLGEDVMGQDCTCGSNEHKLMNLAFDLLGDKDHFCRQIFVSDAAGKYRSEDMLPSKENLLFIVVDFNTNSDKRTYGGHHFVLFNSIGELIYDPAAGTVKSWKNMNRWLVYKVYSRKAQNELVNGPQPNKTIPKDTPKAAPVTEKPKNNVQNTITKEKVTEKPVTKPIENQITTPKKRQRIVVNTRKQYEEKDSFNPYTNTKVSFFNGSDYSDGGGVRAMSDEDKAASLAAIRDSM